ncbi:hypothetical protein HNR29_006478 [Rhizobium leguminosarum]|nr:hypothetical protein [Rhizobium leguminosarum]
MDEFLLCKAGHFRGSGMALAPSGTEEVFTGRRKMIHAH